MFRGGGGGGEMGGGGGGGGVLPKQFSFSTSFPAYNEPLFYY